MGMGKNFVHRKFFPMTIILLIIWLSVILIDQNITLVKAQNEPEQNVILIIWDGTQQNHFLELYNNNQLPNLKSMVDGGGLLRTDLIVNTETCLSGSGDGYDLETGPANSAIVSGYGYPTMQNQDNRLPNPIPAGLTFFERVKLAYPDLKTGMITNKSMPFWPLPALQNAQPTIDFWWAYRAQNYYVTTQTLNFLNTYSSSPFFLFVHYRVPDEAGHVYGENSAEYNSTLIDDDTQLGLIWAQVVSLGISSNTTVIVTTDHGFGENAYDHEACVDDNRNLWIVSNHSMVIGNYAVAAYQTGITPTLFDLYEMDKNAVEPAFPSESLYVMPVPTATPTDTPTPLPTDTATPTDTPAPLPTDTATPTDTPTPLPTDTSTPTETLTPLPTDTATPTETPTPLPTDTATPTDTPTPLPTDTATPTDTPTLLPTDTATPTDTPTLLPTDTATPTDTPTPLPTDTATPTETLTPLPTDTATPTDTPTPSAHRYRHAHGYADPAAHRYRHTHGYADPTADRYRHADGYADLTAHRHRHADGYADPAAH